VAVDEPIPTSNRHVIEASQPDWTAQHATTARSMHCRLVAAGTYPDRDAIRDSEVWNINFDDGTFTRPGLSLRRASHLSTDGPVGPTRKPLPCTRKAVEQGRALRRFLHAPDQWTILGNGTRGGWLDGGCAILADAPREVLGPSADRIMLTDARGAPQHVAVIYRGLVIDGDGFSTQRAFLRRWRTLEHVDGATIEPFDGRGVDTIARDQSASSRLAKLLRQFPGLRSLG
jgi:hypothetical protein